MSLAVNTSDFIFIENILNCYVDKYVKYRKFIENITFKVNLDTIFTNQINIVSIYKKKNTSHHFIPIGYLSKNIFTWFGDENKRIFKNFKKIILKHNTKKLNLDEKFISSLFKNNYILIKNKKILLFFICLLSIIERGYKIIDFQDKETKMTLVGLVKINYHDNFQIEKDFIKKYY